MNIYDVSQKAGVSIATVSRVINDNPNVSTLTKEKVLAVMDELGYTPNIFARGLGLNTMQTIGVICTDSSDIYLANAVYHTEHELRRYGYDSILCCTGNNLENKKKSMQLLISKRVDAIIILGSKFLESKMKENAYIFTASKQIPIMLVNGYLEGSNIFSTMCDDYHAIYDVTEALIHNGRKQLLYLYTSNSYSGLRKKNGYKAALKANEFPAEHALIHICKKHIYDAKELLVHLHNEKNFRFDAVITSDDALAVGALKYAIEHHIKVPEELNIVGYNNSVLALCTEPEITSIDTKVEALCVTTVNTLMRVLNGSNAPVKTMISADIVYRSTTNFTE